MTRGTGVWVLGLGAILLVWGAAILFTSETDVWNSAGLIIGALGGLAVGTGLSLIIYPDSNEVDSFYEDEEEWAGPTRDFPAVPRTPPHRMELPEMVVCLRCGDPECTGEPCRYA